MVLFGSGESTSYGQKICETVFRQSHLAAPIRIGILETPTGFEVNAKHGWPERQEEFYKKRLQNYHPIVTRICAWRKDDLHGTNDPETVDSILSQDYLYSGAGSPSYVINHLSGTLAFSNIRKAHDAGTVLCFGSATAIAIGSYALPVYEIFKVGEDLHWLKGLRFLEHYQMHLAIIPHWNNNEGEDFDSSRCWMGIERLERLKAMLPSSITILGIDENTAIVLDIAHERLDVLGQGNAHIVQHGIEKTLERGKHYPLNVIRILTDLS